MRVTTDSNYTRCAAGSVLDVGIHLAHQICKNSFKNCTAGPLEPPYPFSVDYRADHILCSSQVEQESERDRHVAITEKQYSLYVHHLPLQVKRREYHISCVTKERRNKRSSLQRLCWLSIALSIFLRAILIAGDP